MLEIVLTLKAVDNLIVREWLLFVHARSVIFRKKKKSKTEEERINRRNL